MSHCTCDTCKQARAVERTIHASEALNADSLRRVIGWLEGRVKTPPVGVEAERSDCRPQKEIHEISEHAETIAKMVLEQLDEDPNIQPVGMSFTDQHMVGLCRTVSRLAGQVGHVAARVDELSSSPTAHCSARKGPDDAP